MLTKQSQNTPISDKGITPSWAETSAHVTTADSKHPNGVSPSYRSTYLESLPEKQRQERFNRIERDSSLWAVFQACQLRMGVIASQST